MGCSKQNGCCPPGAKASLGPRWALGNKMAGAAIWPKDGPVRDKQVKAFGMQRAARGTVRRSRRLAWTGHLCPNTGTTNSGRGFPERWRWMSSHSACRGCPAFALGGGETASPSVAKRGDSILPGVVGCPWKGWAPAARQDPHVLPRAPSRRLHATAAPLRAGLKPSLYSG